MREWFGGSAAAAAAGRRLPAPVRGPRRAAGGASRADRPAPGSAPPARLPATTSLDTPDARGAGPAGPARPARERAGAHRASSSTPATASGSCAIRTHPAAELALVPLTVTPMAPGLFAECAEVTVLSSAYLGPPRGRWPSPSDSTGNGVRVFSTASPFPLEQRPHRLSAGRRALPRHPAAAGAGALRGGRGDPRRAPHRQGAHPRRLLRGGAPTRPRPGRPGAAGGAATALDRLGRRQDRRARSSSRLALPTVLVSPSLREGVDLPDDFLRFQVLTKLPYPDLGDPWTAARRERDPRWYAIETAKALLQAYGRSCRHAEDHGVTYCSTRSSRGSCSAIACCCRNGFSMRPGRPCESARRARRRLTVRRSATPLSPPAARGAAAERPEMRPNTAPAMRPAPPG